MPESDEMAVQDVIETFLARLDRGERAAAAAGADRPRITLDARPLEFPEVPGQHRATT